MHIRISTLLKVFVALIAAMLVTGFAILRSQDFNDFKPLIAQQVERLTGRKLVIDGSLDLNVSFTPTLTVQGVHFGNADWGSRPHMMSADLLTARVALLPLLTGQIDIEQILLSGVDVLIESDAEGRANYQFEEPDKFASDAAPTESDLVIPVIRDLRIADAEITYRDAASGRQLNLTIDELKIFGKGARQALKVSLTAALNETPLSVRGTVGSPAEMLNPSKPWPFDAIVETAGSKITIVGSVAEPVAAKGLSLRVEASGTEVARLSELAGVEIPPLGGFRVAARVLGDALGQMSVHDLDATLGNASSFGIKVTGKIGSIRTLEDIDLEVDIRGTELTPLGSLVPVDLPALRPFAIAASVKGDLRTIVLTGLQARLGDSHLAGKIELVSDGVRPRVAGLLTSQRIDLADLPLGVSGGNGTAPARIFPDVPLPLDALRLLDADLLLQIDELATKGMLIKNLSAALMLQDGDLVVRDIAFQFSGGTVRAAARLDAGGSVPALALDLTARDVDLGNLLRETSGINLLDADVTFDADATARGGSVRQIMAGLNGSTKLIVGEGQAKTDMLDLVVGGPLKFVREFFKGGRTDTTTLNCVVSQFEIVDGMATSKVLLVDTEHARITGGGTVNLTDEVLNLRFEARPKSITLNAAVPILIGGTLAKPSYSLEKTAVARKLGGLVGGLLFPPVLIAGLAELGVDNDSPCLAEATASKPSDDLEATQKPAGIKDAVKGLSDGLSKGLKGLLGQ